MITIEQLERLRDLTQPHVDRLPDSCAVNNLILLFDICEILMLSADQLAVIFGAETLRWVTGLVYGEGALDIQR